MICSRCTTISMVQSIVRPMGCIFYYWVDVTYLWNRDIQTRNRKRMSVLQVVHEVGKGRVNWEKVKETSPWDPWKTRNSAYWTENVSEQSVTGELVRLMNVHRLLKIWSMLKINKRKACRCRLATVTVSEMRDAIVPVACLVCDPFINEHRFVNEERHVCSSRHLCTRCTTMCKEDMLLFELWCPPYGQIRNFSTGAHVPYNIMLCEMLNSHRSQRLVFNDGVTSQDFVVDDKHVPDKVCLAMHYVTSTPRTREKSVLHACCLLCMC
jgi:hypothetical protein